VDVTPDEDLSKSLLVSRFAFDSHNTFNVRLPQRLELAEQTALTVALWDDGDIDEGLGTGANGARTATPMSRERRKRAQQQNTLYSGCVRLPFSSLLHLRDGVVTVPFVAPGDDPALPRRGQRLPSYLRGSLTLRVSFVYPHWDHVRAYTPTVFARRIRVLSGDNLPVVDRLPPTARSEPYNRSCVLIRLCSPPHPLTLLSPHHCKPPSFYVASAVIILENTNTVKVRVDV